ncbi:MULTISPECIES: rhomboid family intramembrane serine protease [Streptococcus]|uniref:Rhomboid family intramembrane serine protease n=1 Tax=Streptococcus caledonicus TaxID=2614158 RepID=A0ABW0UHN3_9STRE|nr:rhomboid family intramembrane serine protease [Streptococcus sp. S784/96/1]
MKNLQHIFKQNPIMATFLTLTIGYFLVIQLMYWGQSTTALAIFKAGGVNGNYLTHYPAELWRLISPIFIHIGWEHLIMNMVSLYFVGAMAEQWWGAWGFLTLYLLSGIMGNVFVAFFTPDAVSAGASTSIFGLFAAISVIGYFGSNPYLRQVGQNYQLLLGMNLIFNLFMPGISLAGHIGGAVGGGLCAIFLTTRFDPFIFKPSQRMLALVAYVALLILLLEIVFVRPL